MIDDHRDILHNNQVVLLQIIIFVQSVCASSKSISSGPIIHSLAVFLGLVIDFAVALQAYYSEFDCKSFFGEVYGGGEVLAKPGLFYP